MLELEFVVLGQLPRASEIGGLALLLELDLLAKGVAPPPLDQIAR
ncbi:MAG: hypothetical protein ACR2NX_09085 [Chthoniobacterales bacterium]